MQYNQDCFKLCFTTPTDNLIQYSSLQQSTKFKQISIQNFQKSNRSFVSLNSKKYKPISQGQTMSKINFTLSNSISQREKLAPNMRIDIFNQVECFENWSKDKSNYESNKILMQEDQNRSKVIKLGQGSAKQTIRREQLLIQCRQGRAYNKNNISQTNHLRRLNSSPLGNPQINSNKNQNEANKYKTVSHRLSTSSYSNQYFCVASNPSNMNQNHSFRKRDQKIIQNKSIPVIPYHKYIKSDLAVHQLPTQQINSQLRQFINIKANNKEQMINSSGSDRKLHIVLKKNKVKLEQARSIVSKYDSQRKSGQNRTSDVTKIMCKTVSSEPNNNIIRNFGIAADDIKEKHYDYRNLMKKHVNQKQKFRKTQNNFANSLKKYIQNNVQQQISQEFDQSPLQIDSFTMESINQIKSQIKNGKLIGIGRYFNNNLNALMPVGFIYISKQITSFVMRTNGLQHKIIKSLQVSSRMSHSNILKVLYVIPNGQKLMIAVQYGQSLDKKLSNNGGKFSEQKAITLLRSILLGLSYLHNYAGNGYIHSSLKPSNIIIVNGCPKIEWFGYQDSIISAYTSPQMKRGSILSKKTDIWSLGVIAYLIVYGSLPESDEKFSDFIKSEQPTKNYEEIQNKVVISDKYQNFLLKTICQIEDNRMNTAECLAHPLFDHIK